MYYSKRKTVDLWDVQVDYGYGDGFETVYTATSRSEAKARKKDYIQNNSFGNAVRIHSYREKRNFVHHFIISICQKDGKKFVRFHATSLLAGFRNVQYYTFTEYCDFDTALKDVLEMGFTEYVKSKAFVHRQLSRDVIESELYKIYTTYYDGKMPRIIEDVKMIDERIPQGMYIVKA